MIPQIQGLNFVHPLSRINLVDLTRHLGSLHGVNTSYRFKEQLEGHIPLHNHTIFILLDGFGMNLVKKLDEQHIFKRNLKTPISSMFPSTTSVCLTSLSTGAYPTEHGIAGWWTYLPKYKIDVVPLPFVERFSHNSLETKGIEIGDVFFHKSHFEKFETAVRGYTHKNIHDTIYSKYSIGYHQSLPYDDFEECAKLVLDQLKKTKHKSFHYLYFADIDHAFHRYGIDTPQVEIALEKATKAITLLKEGLPKDATIIITADHGLTNIEDKDKTFLDENDHLMSFLTTPPTCEPRVPVFYVKKGVEKKFKRAFNKRFKNDFLLLSKHDLRKSNLIGIGSLQDRFGDFIALPLKQTILAYTSKENPPPPFRGYHGGLTAEEMEIPLIVI